MAPSSLQHRRTHNLLLISKLLGQRDGASPFTLVLDSLEQSARPLLVEYIARAHASKISVIYISFETLRKPSRVDHFVEAWGHSVQAWRSQVVKHIKSSVQKTLLVIDSLNSLGASERGNLPSVLSSFLAHNTSLVATYHTDVPLSLCKESSRDDYSPSPLVLLQYLATTVFTVYSLAHVLTRKAARERSLAEPSFGLQERADGILQGIGANAAEGLVLEMEHRRKSGRGVQETYFLPGHFPAAETTALKAKERVILLEDHPLYHSRQDHPSGDGPTGVEPGNDTTFELGLTERQRRDREAVVLPYYDAQKGSGEGGRILYDMGEEDDFDEEEDEI